MADAAAGLFDVVLVFHTSRLARNQVEARRYKQLLRERRAAAKPWVRTFGMHADIPDGDLDLPRGRARDSMATPAASLAAATRRAASRRSRSDIRNQGSHCRRSGCRR
ncbi:MAG: hypothetical protein ACYDHN_00660 [Solirubrobacteraceae bacterium]